MPDDIRIIHNEKKKQFEYRQGSKVARLQYGFYKDNIAFTHIDVPEALAGMGIASALTDYAFDYAKKIDKQVMVYCAFVARHVSSHPQLRKQLDRKYHPY